MPPVNDDPPQAAGSAPGAPEPAAAGDQAVQPTAPAGEQPTGAGAQTDPGFYFEGIPPIEDDNA